MLKTKNSIDMINNINYHLDLGRKNNQRLKNSSNEQDVLPYHVYKHPLNKQASQKESISLAHPFIHINTLAQILYEAFHNQTFTAVAPILFVFQPNIVTGISTPGAYAIDFYNDYFVHLKDINIQEFKAGIGEKKGPIAIGYLINQSESIQHSKEFMYQKLQDQTTECMLALQKQLHIHGELEEQIQLSFDLKKIMIPLITLQWIKQAALH
ncbi:hypothetical protein [Bacillus pseudomycoides]|uniref:Uncharacterized protein n=1 Tax=Bacillus pseudomycoides TaxID=64104 RepID=A0A2B6QTB9_9BACI|nr:hypothetical protein [Bacillus pseudomycoides]PDY44366.1 hypothetical protein CON79_25945 [Bacillus pseudomycoides]PEA80289.1 hypothetical protein CON99_29175 [Bacillus pseudomycoides]PED69378.1 hypothetical protein CON97_25530 [Bacillus pseudomycoides]PEI41913.1 hypothetical protein CN620_11090 [Bacillus pseudomycoides]PEJ78980.1 hypothetical protein CN680_11490 [Bacillus pseudomycoides]